MVSFLSGLAAFLGLTSSVQNANTCNGRAEYCSRKYSEVTQVAAHDSPFVGILPTQNQHDSVEDQLRMGIRFLQGQTHDEDGKLQLCHTNCALENAGPAVQFLSKVKNFLDGNPREVITVLLTNQDRSDPSRFNDIINESGLNKYIFTPSTGSAVLPIGDWPTLGQMIDSGKRLVFILDYGADQNRFPHILDEFSYFWETPYDSTDKDFKQCDINRGAPPNGKMYLVNHMLHVQIFGIQIPDVVMAFRTNAVSGAGSITDQANRCKGIYGQAPKAVLLDYVDMGNPIGAELKMNGL